MDQAHLAVDRWASAAARSLGTSGTASGDDRVAFSGGFVPEVLRRQQTPDAERAVVRLEHRFDGSAWALDDVEEAAAKRLALARISDRKRTGWRLPRELVRRAQQAGR